VIKAGPSIAQLATAMVNSAKGVSDLFFSPGRAPQIEAHGSLMAANIPSSSVLTPADTGRFASELIGAHQQAMTTLRDAGACDLSYSIPQVCRFRVNIFKQRGSFAIVMRVIPSVIPTFKDLNLPDELGEITRLKDGLVLVTGPTGSGKSSTLAAIIDKINQEKAWHIVTIEDPIEFLHSHGKSTIHQRELHSDTPSFSVALRAALRQAPKVILVGEMRDRETIEIALTAAETGHLVLSTLHTIDASKTVERIIGAFPTSDERAIRTRLSACFRYFISQRLLPRKDKPGRVAAFEILKSTLRTREYIFRGEDVAGGKSLLDAMEDGGNEGMQHFDAQIEAFMREGTIDPEVGLVYATNPGNLRLAVADILDTPAY
jgi:twitching motility protein PilT